MRKSYSRCEFAWHLTGLQVPVELLLLHCFQHSNVIVLPIAVIIVLVPCSGNRHWRLKFLFVLLLFSLGLFSYFFCLLPIDVNFALRCIALCFIALRSHCVGLSWRWAVMVLPVTLALQSFCALRTRAAT